MRFTVAVAALAGLATAAPYNKRQATQIADGQVQSGGAVTQIADGQIQSGGPATQIADGQVQSGGAATQIADGQVQSGGAATQIADGQVQSGGAATQIADGQVQSGGAATQIADGQVQSGGAATQIADGQVQSSAAPAPAPKDCGQVPFKFPLANGFPNIQVPSAALTEISREAHGTLPNGALPTKLSDLSASVLQLIAVNELFETAYFSSLINNITDGTYTVGSPAVKSVVLEAITAVRAQEELHAIGANAILASAGRETIQPCEYIFPVSDFDSAIKLAGTFTDVVLGTLQQANAVFASTGDAELIPLVTSIVAQEGEQDGYYRSLGMRIPSSNPFLTRSSANFAFSAVGQNFLVPGSCPNINILPFTLFGPLTVITPPGAANSTVQYSFVNTDNLDPATLSLTLINQQNTPTSYPLQNVAVSGQTVTFGAEFPYEALLLDGLTIAAVTTSAGPFADADAVSAATKFGPGLIEVN